MRDQRNGQPINERVARLERSVAQLGRELERLCGAVEFLFGSVEALLGIEDGEEPGELPTVAARLPLPDVGAMMDALLDVGAAAGPVSATEVAGVLWHGEHGHADLIRLGQRLGLMASAGMVVRHPVTRHRSSRWALAETAI